MEGKEARRWMDERGYLGLHALEGALQIGADAAGRIGGEGADDHLVNHQLPVGDVRLFVIVPPLVLLLRIVVGASEYTAFLRARPFLQNPPSTSLPYPLEVHVILNRVRGRSM